MKTYSFFGTKTSLFQQGKNLDFDKRKIQNFPKKMFNENSDFGEDLDCGKMDQK